jgi:hypothetical protein
MLDKLKQLYRTHKVEAWGILALILAIVGYFVYEKSSGATGATGASGISASQSSSGQGNDTNTATTSTTGGQVGQTVMKPTTPTIPATNHPVINEANSNVAATTGIPSSDSAGMSKLPTGS